MPDKKDREAWWDFICGAPESVWNKPPSKRSIKPKRKSGGGLQGELDPSDPDVAAAGWQIVQSSPQPIPDNDPPALTTSTSDPAPAELTSTPSSPREPTPTLILSMDHVRLHVFLRIHLLMRLQRMAIHLIMYFTFWINQHLEALNRPTKPFTPLESHARWIFALLARVDSYCSADDMNGLRSLVRACLAFIRAQNAASQDDLPENDVGDADSDIASTPGARPADLPPTGDLVNPVPHLPSAEEIAQSVGGTSSQSSSVMSANSVRLILCAVAGYWNQRDLWSDAVGAFT